MDDFCRSLCLLSPHVSRKPWNQIKILDVSSLFMRSLYFLVPVNIFLQLFCTFSGPSKANLRFSGIFDPQYLGKIALSIWRLLGCALQLFEVPKKAICTGVLQLLKCLKKLFALALVLSFCNSLLQRNSRNLKRYPFQNHQRN